MSENQPKTVAAMAKSDKDFALTLLLCLFLGVLGIHRFYVGKIGTELLMLLTLGFCGIWVVIDLVVLACGSFTDVEGKLVRQ